MSKLLNEKLIQIILDITIFCEFSDKNTINEDASLSLMEEIAAELSNLDLDDKNKLISTINKLLLNYNGDKKEFLQNFPYNFGLAV